MPSESNQTTLATTTVLPLVLRWDYGDPTRGPSCEQSFFVEPLRQLTETTDPVWIDELPIEGRAGAIIARVRALTPDLIFTCPFGSEFAADLLEELGSIAPVAAWFGDDSWRFDSYTRNLAPHVRHPITTDPFSVPRYREIGIEPVVSQWAAVAPAEPTPPFVQGDPFEFDVTFVGGRNSVRSWFIRQLAKRGVRVECFGAGWPNGRLDEARMREIFRSSRISLNLSNSVPRDLGYVMSGPRALANLFASDKRAEQIKARNFEIPIAGGFQLTNWVRGVDRYLAPGREVAIYGDLDECAAQVEWYLAHPEERDEIAVAGWRRAVEHHSWEARLDTALRAIADR